MNEAREEVVNPDDQFDCEGFLADQEFWSKDIAESLAKLHDIGEHRLLDDHWKIINFVRDYYDKYGTGPAMVRVVKHTGLSLDDICRLFPCGLVKGAYRLAGLPKPSGCA